MYSSGGPVAPVWRTSEWRVSRWRPWALIGSAGVPVTVTMIAAVVLAVVIGTVPAARAQPTPDAVRTASASSASASPPAGTVVRADRFAVDLDGRVLFLHGPAVPPGVAVDIATVAQWVASGFTAVSLGVSMGPDGTFTATAGRAGVQARRSADVTVTATVTATAAATDSDGLDQLAASVQLATGQGLRVMIQIVPTVPATRVGDEAYAAALRRVSSRFHDVAGLVGFELVAPPSASSSTLNGAVRAQDAHHLLWRQSTAPFDPTATVVINDEAALLVGWPDGDPAAVARLAAAADTTQIGWFFDRPLTDTAAAVVARPYPSVIAGVPVGFTYTPSGRLLALSYLPVSATGGTFGRGVTTQIRVPARAYPDGYLVRASGATVVSAPGAGVVCLVTDVGASRVDVRVEPAATGQAPPVAPPVAGDPCPPARGTAGATATGARTPVPASPDGKVNGVLLWTLPLAGAAGMAALLGCLFWRARRGQANWTGG